MIWILLAALGIPLWLVLLGLLVTLRTRRRALAIPGVFRAKVRVVSGDVPGLRPSFPRGRVAARWVHDVLLIHRGPALVRCAALGVAGATGPRAAADDATVRGLGPAPVVLALELDHGATIEVAASHEDAGMMIGPFAEQPAGPESRLATPGGPAATPAERTT